MSDDSANDAKKIANSSSSCSAVSATSSSSMEASLSNRFKLISLSSLVATALIFLLQIYLVYLSLSNLTSLERRSHNIVVTNGLLVGVALLFSLLHALSGAIRLGIYSHDNFCIGKGFDKSKIKSKELLIEPSKSNSISLGSNPSTTNSKHKLTKSLSFESVFKLRCLSNKFKLTKSWSEMPPLGACFHLVSALVLLIAECQLTSEQIQFGVNPLGDIFSTKLDFLFGPPFNRIGELSFNKPTNNTVPPINDLIHSKDDFSIFSTSKNYQQQQQRIALSYLNFLVALLVVGVKLSQTFWHASRRFSLVLFAYMLNIGLLMALSYASYEVLLKANKVDKISVHFIFSSMSRSRSGSLPSNTEQPASTLAHDTLLTSFYLISSALLVTNGFLKAKFGFDKFESVRLKFEANIGKYLSASFLKQQGMSFPKTLDSGSSCPSVMTDKTGYFDYLKKCFKFGCSFKEQLISSFLFLVYAGLRIFFIYEVFVIYKFTNDALFAVCIAAELITILTWVLMIILFTIKNEWHFVLEPAYKLNYWNWLYTNYLADNEPARTNSCTSRNSSTFVSIKTSSRQCPALPKRLNTTGPIVNDMPSQLIQDLVTNQDLKSNGLLVRDDSLVLNRSSNLSTSSITEVSSLMPSQCTQFIQSNSNRSFNSIKKLVLNVTNLAPPNVANDHENSSNFTDTNGDDFQQRPSRPSGGQKVKNNFTPTSSLRSSFTNSNSNSIVTIEEIMQQQQGAKGRQPFLGNNKSTLGRTSNFKPNLNGSKVAVNDGSSSQTTTDSGMDSLNDSPVNQANKHNILKSKPFLIEANTPSVAVNTSLTNLKLTASTQLLDTHC